MILSVLALGPSVLVMLAARYFAARALGMKGIELPFGGAIDDARAATPLKRVAVVLASLSASYLLAGVCLAAATLYTGTPVYGTEVSVIPGKPAATAGMRSGDRVTSVAGRSVEAWDDLSAGISAHAGEPIEIVARRGDEEVRFTVTPVGDPGHGKIGVGARGAKMERAHASDVLDALVVMPMRTIVDWVRGLADFAAGRDTVAAPAQIVQALSTASERVPTVVLILALLGRMLALAWPVTAIVAIAIVPRRRKG
jgi:membrane-associated protease RseP (regulator of RpoE activity)